MPFAIAQELQLLDEEAPGYRQEIMRKKGEKSRASKDEEKGIGTREVGKEKSFVAQAYLIDFI